MSRDHAAHVRWRGDVCDVQRGDVTRGRVRGQQRGHELGRQPLRAHVPGTGDLATRGLVTSTALMQGIPESSLRRTSDHAMIYLFEANTELEEKLTVKTLPDIINTNVTIGDGPFVAPVKIFTPPHMEPDMKYPVIVYVYGGPGFQQVDKLFRF